MIRDRIFYLVEYIENQKSPREIAEEQGSDTKTIQRELIKLGFPRRRHAEAQKLVLKRGVAPHPTKGKHHTPESREKTSRTMKWRRSLGKTAEDPKPPNSD